MPSNRFEEMFCPVCGSPVVATVKKGADCEIKQDVGYHADKGWFYIHESGGEEV